MIPVQPKDGLVDYSGRDSGPHETHSSLSPFVIALRIQPTTKGDCKNGDWQKWRNPSFKNQGECTKFVNHS